MTLNFEMNDATGADSGRIVLLSDLLLLLGIGSTATTLETDIARHSLTIAEGAVIRHLKYNPVMSVRTEFYPGINFAGQRNPVWDANDTHAYVRELSVGVGDELQLLGLPLRQADSNGSNAIEVRVDFDGRAGSRSGSFGTDTIKVEGEDFFPNYDFVDSGSRKVARDGMIRSNGLWPAQAGSVKVTYVAGYTAAEFAGTDSILDASPIREAVVDEATRRVHKAYSRMKKRVGFGVGPLTSENIGDYSYSADGAILAQLVGSSSDIMAETALKLEDFVNYGAMLAS